MFNTKRVLDELYEIKVSQTISQKTILHFKHLLNNENCKKQIKTILERFYEHENLTSLYLTDKQNYFGREYLKTKLLTKDLNNFRRNENVVFSDLILAVILKYYNKIRFLFTGYVCISNGFWEHYEPCYKIIIFNKETDEYYEIEYFHFNCKDYQLVDNDFVVNNKFSYADKRLYIVEKINL